MPKSKRGSQQDSKPDRQRDSKQDSKHKAGNETMGTLFPDVNNPDKNHDIADALPGQDPRIGSMSGKDLNKEFEKLLRDLKNANENKISEQEIAILKGRMHQVLIHCKSLFENPNYIEFEKNKARDAELKGPELKRVETYCRDELKNAEEILKKAIGLKEIEIVGQKVGALLPGYNAATHGTTHAKPGTSTDEKPSVQPSPSPSPEKKP